MIWLALVSGSLFVMLVGWGELERRRDRRDDQLRDLYDELAARRQSRRPW